jgi:hypothetical protein
VYSLNCNTKKRVPYIIVINKAINVKSFLPAIVAWCAKVKTNPDPNNTLLPNNGIAHGFTGFIPIGGHIPPYSTAGDKLE